MQSNISDSSGQGGLRDESLKLERIITICVSHLPRSLIFSDGNIQIAVLRTMQIYLTS